MKSISLISFLFPSSRPLHFNGSLGVPDGQGQCHHQDAATDSPAPFPCHTPRSAGETPHGPGALQRFRSSPEGTGTPDPGTSPPRTHKGTDRQTQSLSLNLTRIWNYSYLEDLLSLVRLIFNSPVNLTGLVFKKADLIKFALLFLEIRFKVNIQRKKHLQA